MKQPLDPEKQRWNEKYPRFPGIAKCVELLGRSNVQGSWVDIICYELERHASENAEELIAATRIEIDRNSRVGRILLNVVSDAGLPEAINLFADLLQSSDVALRRYGETGLKRLDTKEARGVLWEYGTAKNRGTSTKGSHQ